MGSPETLHDNNENDAFAGKSIEPLADAHLRDEDIDKVEGASAQILSATDIMKEEKVVHTENLEKDGIELVKSYENVMKATQELENKLLDQICKKVPREFYERYYDYYAIDTQEAYEKLLDKLERQEARGKYADKDWDPRFAYPTDALHTWWHKFFPKISSDIEEVKHLEENKDDLSKRIKNVKLWIETVKSAP